MHTHSKPQDPRTLLSMLWIFLLMNIVFRDIHQFLAPGYMDGVLAGEVFGQQITDELLLFGGFAVEAMIAMVLLPLVLPRRALRLVNSVAAVFTTGLVLYTPPTDPDDVFFLVIVLATLLAILWFGWTRFAASAGLNHRAVSNLA
ncbi:MAG: DUF6326 family protein [Pseudomonadota bacterium]